MEIRQLPQQEKRVETGPVQFGDDWPGLFVRGDNALYYAHLLSGIIGRLEKSESLEGYDLLALRMIRDELKEVRV